VTSNTLEIFFLVVVISCGWSMGRDFNVDLAKGGVGGETAVN